jgi:hypothetical protein
MAGRSHRQRPIIALFAATRMNAGLPKNDYCEVRDHLLPYFWEYRRAIPNKQKRIGCAVI